MADVSTLKAAGLSDADIAGLLSFSPSSMTIGGGQDEAARALAAAQATGVSNLGYVPVYGGGDIIPGTTQGILSRLGIENPYSPIFQTVGSENSGTAMDATERTTFAPTPGQTYRLVDNRTGETFGQASDPVGIKALVDQANALSEEQGKKANWDLQQSTLYSADPNQPLKQGWNTIAQDDPNTIPMSIKAMMAAMAVMTGAGIAQQINAAGAAASAGGAGGAGAGSGLVPNALSGLSFAPVGTAAVPASTIAGALGAAAVPAAVTAGSDLVITALMAKGLTATQAAALVASGGAAAALSGAGSSASTAGAANTTPTAQTTGPDLTITAGTPTNLLPASLLVGGGAAAAAAANAAGSTTSAADLAASRTGMTPAETAAVNAGAGGTSFLDTIISNMGIRDYATLASLAASAVGGGGGGGTGSTTPYVSPFGAGTNFGGLASRTQINPNIIDYEKYGFGPEAQFFSGVQGGGLPGTGTGTATVTKDTPYTGGTLTLPEGTTAGVTPPTTPVTTTTTAPATPYQTNLKDPDIFSYMKTVNDSLGSFYKMGQMTDQQVRDYQQKMYDAINTPGATIDTFRSAVAMPQYTMFNQPTGTPSASVPAPFEYVAPAQPIQNLSAYMNDLNSQIGSRVSQGLLSVADAQKIQGDLTNAYRSGGATTQGLQSAFDAASQKYKPLI